MGRFYDARAAYLHTKNRISLNIFGGTKIGRRGPKPGDGGRPPKPLAEKLMNGNPGKRKLKVLKSFPDLECEVCPPPKEYLSAEQRDGNKLQADLIFKSVWDWINDRGCQQKVSPELIEHYSVSCARHIQCEKIISQYGLLAKNIQGNAIVSPYVEISHMYLKSANSFWLQINSIIRENCSVEYKGDFSNDLMTKLLNS